MHRSGDYYQFSGECSNCSFAQNDVLRFLFTPTPPHLSTAQYIMEASKLLFNKRQGDEQLTFLFLSNGMLNVMISLPLHLCRLPMCIGKLDFKLTHRNILLDANTMDILTHQTRYLRDELLWQGTPHLAKCLFTPKWILVIYYFIKDASNFRITFWEQI